MIPCDLTQQMTTIESGPLGWRGQAAVLGWPQTSSLPARAAERGRAGTAQLAVLGCQGGATAQRTEARMTRVQGGHQNIFRDWTLPPWVPGSGQGPGGSVPTLQACLPRGPQLAKVTS